MLIILEESQVISRRYRYERVQALKRGWVMVRILWWLLAILVVSLGYWCLKIFRIIWIEANKIMGDE